MEYITIDLSQKQYRNDHFITSKWQLTLEGLKMIKHRLLML